MMLNAIEIIKKYYDENSELYKILVDHSNSVTRKALDIASSHPEFNMDKSFVSEAGMLHDIGIIQTYAPSIQCYGEHPYISHGYLGSDLMMREGFPKHALVCERHTGAGLTLDEIIEQNLPIPHRGMMPQTIEEKVICFADNFFSKTQLGKEKPIDKIINGLSRFGTRPAEQFREWCDLFL